MKRNPDNRDDNVEHLQNTIDGTVRNIRKANEAIRATSNEKTREELIAKNERRSEALDGLRHEIKDEADYQERK
ncbi:MAG: small acid-soluble spore protein Tlp [Clostridiales bacterium]|nr:small acid-soluble spore protein Tlp [Clostridiales bacterium]